MIVSQTQFHQQLSRLLQQDTQCPSRSTNWWLDHRTKAQSAQSPRACDSTSLDQCILCSQLYRRVWTRRRTDDRLAVQTQIYCFVPCCFSRRLTYQPTASVCSYGHPPHQTKPRVQHIAWALDITGKTDSSLKEQCPALSSQCNPLWLFQSIWAMQIHQSPPHACKLQT